jgi:DNA repair protein RadA/Sms
MTKDKHSAKTTFICQQCGKESPKWLGRCPECQQWNTFVETIIPSPTRKSTSSWQLNKAQVQELNHVIAEKTPRITVSCNELNRVLGGGIVPGSLVLVSGDPGIGKSTLLLQTCAMICHPNKILYVSGEESISQIKLRSARLGIDGERLFVMAETNLESIMQEIQELSPSFVVVDSIQTIYLEELDSAPRSVGQIRECAIRLMQWAKSSGVPIFITGHVTKDGVIAGPKILEHIVDVVLYLEGDNYSSFRLLRGIKNRFGSTNEIGVFEMRDAGMVEVENPSQFFLAERSQETIGSATVPIIEGSRSLLVEIQALTSNSSFGLPRRTANGVDFNRLILIAAVLSKRAGISLYNQDIIVNVAGGLKIDEPAADLGIAIAIASSFYNAPVDPTLAIIGEVGLSGEIRAVAQIDRRLTEVSRLGFEKCLVPQNSLGKISAMPNLKLIGVSSLRESIKKATLAQIKTIESSPI